MGEQKREAKAGLQKLLLERKKELLRLQMLAKEKQLAQPRSSTAPRVRLHRAAAPAGPGSAALNATASASYCPTERSTSPLTPALPVKSVVCGVVGSPPHTVQLRGQVSKPAPVRTLRRSLGGTAVGRAAKVAPHSGAKIVRRREPEAGSSDMLVVDSDGEALPSQQT